MTFKDRAKELVSKMTLAEKMAEGGYEVPQRKIRTRGE